MKEKPQLGYYSEGNRRLVSVTSVKQFTLGLAPELAKWIEKQTLLTMVRKQRELKRNLTQKEILAFGKEARIQILEKSRNAGIEAHQAIQNYNSQLPYELHEDHQSLFEAYLNWAKFHTIEPILEEFKVKNTDFGYAGRLDFYGKIDGKYTLIDYKATTIVDWSYGLQLAAYRKCLEDLGYQVDQMMILHLKPWVRGGIPIAEPYYFDTPFKAWEALLTLFHTKLALVDVDWYSRTDEAAVESQIKEEAMTEVIAPLVVQPSDVQGHPLDIPDTSPTAPPEPVEPTGVLVDGHLSQGDRQLLSSIPVALELVEEIHSNQSNSPLEDQPDEVSSHTGGIQPDKLPSGSLEDVRQTLRDSSPLPSAKDISADPELDLDSLPDSRHKPRQAA